jgi:hypothetical protein
MAGPRCPFKAWLAAGGLAFGRLQRIDLGADSFFSVFMWVARLQAPRRHLAAGSGKDAQNELPFDPKTRSQPSHSVTTVLQLPPLNEQPFLDINVQSTPGFKVAQCMAVAPLDIQ